MKSEKIFWSIAFPGLGQLLNGKYVKGILFIGLELIINVQANFNETILYSFQGDIPTAIRQTDYGWLMFYPCLYFFAIWDAFKDAGGGKSPYAFFPFVFAAYFVTIGLFYSSKLTLFGVLFGPLWLPALFLIPGLLVGWLIKKLLVLLHKLE